MSEQDENHADIFLDTTDEGYLNYLLHEKDLAIQELANALKDSARLFRLFAPNHFTDYPKAACMVELQEYERLAEKYLNKL